MAIAMLLWTLKYAIFVFWLKKALRTQVQTSYKTCISYCSVRRTHQSSLFDIEDAWGRRVEPAVRGTIA